MFINLSNHPSSEWSERQLAEAREYGDIIDIPFPAVSPWEDEAYIASLSADYLHDILSGYHPAQDVFHIMGEMCFSFSLVRKLQEKGFTCLASTSERIVTETSPGHKEVCFHFIRFRNYE